MQRSGGYWKRAEKGIEVQTGSAIILLRCGSDIRGPTPALLLCADVLSVRPALCLFALKGFKWLTTWLLGWPAVAAPFLRTWSVLYSRWSVLLEFRSLHPAAAVFRLKADRSLGLNLSGICQGQSAFSTPVLHLIAAALNYKRCMQPEIPLGPAPLWSASALLATPSPDEKLSRSLQKCICFSAFGIMSEHLVQDLMWQFG